MATHRGHNKALQGHQRGNNGALTPYASSSCSNSIDYSIIENSVATVNMENYNGIELRHSTENEMKDYSQNVMRKVID